ncbi:glycosyltransferase [Antarcticibacterium arcticum]|uniref:Glycosyltransferase n=1 Tax=Antarcticibacterium arcticum TaxID=2585771 RepID=A0A5B8YF42_9FLAO|nr:glycosyltransferase [Antarcticibacterium arcticum]QED36525.1 glycosyltransferase [Antarcticibacterium arcticum]
MKILHIIHKPQNRGAETFTCQLSHHLLKLGHEVKIVAIYEGCANLPYSPTIENLMASTSKKVIDIPAWKKLAKIVKNFNPDIVQANSGDTLKYAVLSKIFFRWKIPIVSRNASEVGRYLNSFFQIRLNKFLYKNVDWIISVSQESKKDILNHFPFLATKIEIIPVGLEKNVDIDFIQLYPLEKKHLVHVGGFSFEKNHFGLLNIFELVIKEEPQVHLHLIGDGPLKMQFIKEVQNRGLEGEITFYGFVSQPLPYIKSANVLVLPSIIEGLPGVLLEAMYCKTPVIAYNVGGISEVINSKTGTIVEKGKELLFAQGIIKIMTDPDQDQIAYAHKMVNSNFMNDQLALSFVNSYQKIIGLK